MTQEQQNRFAELLSELQMSFEAFANQLGYKVIKNEPEANKPAPSAKKSK